MKSFGEKPVTCKSFQIFKYPEGSVSVIITRLIVIDIAPLTVLFCNYLLSRNCPLSDLLLPAVKKY